MAYDLPALPSLPAFEAAGRLKSFTLAAHELGLTQAAISYQVRSLERTLDTHLFVRRHRALDLTQEGRDLLSAVQSAFATLAAGKRLATGPRRSTSVTISAPISLCGRWLVQRVHRLAERAPGIGLRIDANDAILDLDGSDVQMAIRYSAAPPTALAGIRLLEDDVFPVCSPRLHDPGAGHALPPDLAGSTLLHDQMPDFTWRDWFALVGLDPELAAAGIGFSYTGTAIDAAVAGQGVALGRLPLVADLLQDGRLVRPFPEQGTSSYAYYLLRAPRARTQPEADAVADWLASEAAALARLAPIADSHERGFRNRQTGHG